MPKVIEVECPVCHANMWIDTNSKEGCFRRALLGFEQAEEGIMTKNLGVDRSSSLTYYGGNLPVMVAASFIWEISDEWRI